MPEWITPLFRVLVAMPSFGFCSTRNTSSHRCETACAIAQPITPPPIIRMFAWSIKKRLLFVISLFHYFVTSIPCSQLHRNTPCTPQALPRCHHAPHTARACPLHIRCATAKRFRERHPC